MSPAVHAAYGTRNLVLHIVTTWVFSECVCVLIWHLAQLYQALRGLFVGGAVVAFKLYGPKHTLGNVGLPEIFQKYTRNEL